MHLEFSIMAGYLIWYFFVLWWWPYDFKGKRKAIKLNKRKDDWDE